ncbi:MAG: 3-deoxy-7-phosphoheptulonate synthase [Clostridiales bacterium]|nr:3-deoxy-7-phosphoheptulonate synthase [Clostridiales bacterium]
MEKLIVENEKFNTIGEMFSLKNDFAIIAGPCSIESEEQTDYIADKIKKMGVTMLRGGAYKPRTSPYAFQGMQKEGLAILKKVGKKHNLKTVSELMDVRDLETVINSVDLIQVGSRNMANFSLLKELGKTNKPILLKRGLMSTVDEFIYAAEYIAMGGNRNIILCERGIRTFENATRNTLDLSCVPIIKSRTNLPIIVDLSHSLGRKDIVVQMAKASKACGADGIMVEVHNNPEKALSDSLQQLTINEFEVLVNEINKFNI